MQEHTGSVLQILKQGKTIVIFDLYTIKPVFYQYI